MVFNQPSTHTLKENRFGTVLLTRNKKDVSRVLLNGSLKLLSSLFQNRSVMRRFIHIKL